MAPLSSELRITAIPTRNTLTVNHAALVLKRFYFLLREVVKMQAGWLPGTASLEVKLELAHSLWENALIAKELRERVLELRYPERRMQPDEDDGLLAQWRTFANAPDGLQFFAGVTYGLKPFLRRLFCDYLEASDHLDDSPTVRILRHAVEDLDAQAERASRLDVKEGPWTESIHSALPETGGWLSEVAPPVFGFVFGFNWQDAGGKPFAIARRAVRDPRFPQPLFAWPDRLSPSRSAGEGMELQVRAAVHHLNEIWATEMAAAVLYDLLEESPPEFLEDSARWCFDESRHCRMGYTRLQEFGFNPSDIPIDTFSYDAGEALDPVERLGIIYYFETTYIHTKSERAKLFAQYGDTISSHDMDYDWADELIHTYYGNKWLKYFLEKEGSQRTAKQIKETAEAAVKVLRSAATEGDRDETERHYRTILGKATILGNR